MTHSRRTGIGVLGALVAAVGWYAARIEPRWLDIRRYRVLVPTLPPAFDGYRIAHVADLHLSARFIRAHLPVIVQAINREAVDLVALTGDYVTSHQETARDFCAPLADLRAPDGAWSILGNHDLAAGAGTVITALHAAGIHVLRNQHHVLRRGDDHLVLAGVDDVVRGRPDLAATLHGLPDRAPVILLAHEPDFARIAAADRRIVLQLSGHAHGGQFRLPVLNKHPYLPALAHLYPAGVYRVGTMLLYVSRGLGVTMLHLRFNCRPELPIFTLVRSPVSLQQNGHKPRG